MTEDQIKKALDGVIAWDASRNYIIPYKVRDPVLHAINVLEGCKQAPPGSYEPDARLEALFAKIDGLIQNVHDIHAPALKTQEREALARELDRNRKALVQGIAKLVARAQGPECQHYAGAQVWAGPHRAQVILTEVQARSGAPMELAARQAARALEIAQKGGS